METQWVQIDSNEWEKALSWAESGLSLNENIEQANRFIFQDEKVFSFNDEILVCAPLATGLTGAVIAKECMAVLGQFPKNAPVEMMVEENMLVFKSKQKNKVTKAGLDFQTEITLPLEEISDLKKLKWKALPENFAQGLANVYPSASKSEAYSVLQSVHIKGEYIEATDNFNLVRYKIKGADLPEMCLYYQSVQKLLKFAVSSFSLAENWVFFKTKEHKIIVGIRNFEQINFPTLDEFFKNFKGAKIQLPENITEALSKASIFSSCTDPDQLMDFYTKKGFIVLKIQNEKGFLEEKIKVKEDLPEFRMSVSLPQLSQIIKKSNSFELGENLARVKDENTQYISALK